jgi:hypothetical protein
MRHGYALVGTKCELLCTSYQLLPILLQVFLEGVKAALTADSSFQDGWYEKTPSKGLRAVARICAGWGFSQAFYWTEVKSL